MVDVDTEAHIHSFSREHVELSLYGIGSSPEVGASVDAHAVCPCLDCRCEERIRAINRIERIECCTLNEKLFAIHIELVALHFHLGGSHRVIAGLVFVEVFPIGVLVVVDSGVFVAAHKQ